MLLGKPKTVSLHQRRRERLLATDLHMIYYPANWLGHVSYRERLIRHDSATKVRKPLTVRLECVKSYWICVLRHDGFTGQASCYVSLMIRDNNSGTQLKWCQGSHIFFSSKLPDNPQHDHQTSMPCSSYIKWRDNLEPPICLVCLLSIGGSFERIVCQRMSPGSHFKPNWQISCLIPSTCPWGIFIHPVMLEVPAQFHGS